MSFDRSFVVYDDHLILNFLWDLVGIYNNMFGINTQKSQCIKWFGHGAFGRSVWETLVPSCQYNIALPQFDCIKRNNDMLQAGDLVTAGLLF